MRFLLTPLHFSHILIAKPKKRGVFMQFDSEALNRLLSQSDDKLWQLICKIGAMNGISLCESPPSAEEMKRLRAMLAGAGKADYNQALEMVKKYRAREG
jgi:hypothetical protein